MCEGHQLKRLERASLQLVEQREMLENHASFNPIFHMVWRMPVKGPRTAKPIHLFAGKNLATALQKEQLIDNQLLEKGQIPTEIPAVDVLNQNNQSVVALESTPTTELTEQTLINSDKWAIDGNFKVYLDHYLYIDSQLIIRKEVTEDIIQEAQVVDVFDDENGVQIATKIDEYINPKAVQQTVVKEILFDQNRRLRSEEIHYLDHPLMGIIVQIRKIPEVELQENVQPLVVMSE